MNLFFTTFKILQERLLSKKAKALIICDKEYNFVSLSIKGKKIKYSWNNELLKINSSTSIEMYPICIDIFVKNEIKNILMLENIKDDEVIICSPSLSKLHEITLFIDDFDKNRKDNLDRLYSEYIEEYILTDDLLNEAKVCNLEKELNSLVLLEKGS